MIEGANVVAYQGNNILDETGLCFKKKWVDILEDEEKREKLKKEKEKKKKKVLQLKQKENRHCLQGDDVDNNPVVSKAGKEIFIGNLDFSDLESVWPVKLRFNLRDERRKRILDLISSLGDVIEIRTLWKRGCAFVVFRDTSQAESTIVKLSNYDERKKLCKDIQKKLKEDGISEKATPRPSFYSRYPMMLTQTNLKVAS